MSASLEIVRKIKPCSLLSLNFFVFFQDSELIKKQEQLFPDQIIVEICRFGASELHVISAIIGGVAAQEAIKLCTNQYIPVDNCLIYDGNSQNATSFKN